MAAKRQPKKTRQAGEQQRAEDQLPADGRSEPSDGTRANHTKRDVVPFGGPITVGMGLFLAATILYIAYVLYTVWPYTLPIVPDEEDTYIFPFCSTPLVLGTEGRYLIIAFMAGALGGMIQAASSFIYWVGKGETDRDWVWWYLLRPFIGGSVSLVVYFAFRAGLVGSNNVDAVNLFGVAAISAMAGLFSRQALDKRAELFNSFFAHEDKKKKNGESNGDTNQDGNASASPPRQGSGADSEPEL